MIRIGNCSGFYGDRLSAMREMLEGGHLDYLTGDYLAELTMLILGKDRMKDADLGYAKTFLRQLTHCLALAREKQVKIVTNAGGLNPAGLADKIREIATEQGVEVRVAHVEGDDLIARSAELGWEGALTANAYLGAFGIAEALTAGADIVVTGRVTDASVIVGPAIAEHGWGREDHDQLAGAVVAGHIIECGTQATGGNFSGFTDIDTSRPLGFPIAEIAADGTSVITKHPGTGGAVTIDTVTAQLVYEIGGPVYLNPDVATHLDTIELAADGEDRVRVSGVQGSPPPATTKVALNSLGGFRNSVEFVLTGLDIETKADWVRAQLGSALDRLPLDEVDWELVRTDRADPATEPEAAAILRCHVKSQDARAAGRAFSGAAIELALASYPGFHVTAPPSAASPFGVYRAAYVAQADVPHVVVMDDGRRIDIAPPPTVAGEDPASGAISSASGAYSPSESAKRGEFAPLGGAANAEPGPGELTGDGETVRKALGRLVYARSGDKGGAANIGVWIPSDHPRREAAYTWLAATLTADRVRQLLPETAGLDIAVHALPNLAAVNLVVEKLLGDGVASSTRFDPQAKAVGEWLRARLVDIPRELLA
ncbi:exopolyphosphatase [Aeromicrobium sp. PE09-221]|uniref:acyclic terpene utilization AtuA family protein n=1 Tax=Aeromicrobium sp. PE09-221 TaxID=1898043 RepID=UPI000B3E93A8|nr:acyclic terpene utilization AtuA family protein [Aeromicrobium sp. PE09-221]OUZ10559.1 exopolyphosphatase [Aeromicrobium sp. PE09-221]